MSRYSCHRCGAPADVEPPVPRTSECVECGADHRCCMNCRHYAPGQHNSCAEPAAEMVEDKHRRNFCEYFEFSEAAWDTGADQARRADDAREKLSALFGDSGGTAKAPGAAREKLESLFGPDRGATPDDRQKKARQELDRLFGGGSDSEDD